MHAALICAIALTGQGGAQATITATPSVTTEVRIFELEGLAWRRASHLSPVVRRGTVSVWTAPDTETAALADGARSVTKSPRVTAAVDSPATIGLGLAGPVDFDVARAAFLTSTRQPAEAAAPRSKITVSGRPLDQGVLAKVSVSDAQVLALHSVGCVDGKACCSDTGSETIPEVATSQVSGEWLIPKDGTLVIGLGPHTVADKDGKAAVRERVVVLRSVYSHGPEKAPTQDPSAGRVSLEPISSIVRPKAIALTITLSAPTTPRDLLAAQPIARMPALPSRSTPAVMGPDGKPMALPPLPDDQAEPTSHETSGEPRPTPQTHQAIRQAVDTAIDRVQMLDGVKVFAGVSSEDEGSKSTAGPVGSSVTSRLPVIRIPVGAGIVVEVPASLLLRNVGVGRPN